jgi:hypothetical protein
MWLVEQAAVGGNLAEREICAQHHALSKFNPSTPEKAAGRNVERLLKCAAKVAIARAYKSRQLRY